MDPRPRKTIVVPVYNEAERLDTLAFDTALADDPDLSFLFVDDGSTDDTRQALERWFARRAENDGGAGESGRVSLLCMPENRGKGEAVRRGLLHLLALDDKSTESPTARGIAPWLGYWDADLSADLTQIGMMAQLGEEQRADVVLGARARLLGHQIERSPTRHYLGRVFATAAALYLQTPVYDTQCGAKLMRASGRLKDALTSPFESRWIFDVELIGRLLDGGARVIEFPLRRWTAVAGSKVSPASYLRAGLDFVRIVWKNRDSRRLGGREQD